MKTTATALVIAIAVALTAPAFAAPKKSKRVAKPADTMSEAQKTNDASWRLVKGSLPIWLPSWAQPIYQNVKSDDGPQVVPKRKKARIKAAQR